MAEEFRASHVVAPLRIGERVIGTLCVGSSKARAFSDESADVLIELARSAAIAFENARLYEELEKVVILRERQRIAAEMHDGLAQTLSFFRLKVDQIADLIETGREKEALDEMQDLDRTVAQASQEVRNAISKLQEDLPPHRALEDELTMLAQEFSQVSKLPTDLKIEVEAPLHLARDETEQVVRVVREALQNVARHGNATHATVCLKREGTQAMVIVEDDGCGFNPGTAIGREQHFGLSIMHARATSVGGALMIDSTPGQGTQLTLTWPLERATNREEVTRSESLQN